MSEYEEARDEAMLQDKHDAEREQDMIDNPKYYIELQKQRKIWSDNYWGRNK